MEKRMAELFRKFLLNDCTEEELNEFFQCIRKSKDDDPIRNVIRETYEAIRNASDSYVDHTGELVVPAGDEKNIAPLPEFKRNTRKIRAVLLAACMATVVFLSFLYVRKAANPRVYAIQHQALKKSVTESSEYKYLLLPDSSQVWLNAGSSLEYPDHFGETSREVFLSGEAYFDIKHAAEHPFLIHTGKILTTVLGTAFNINAYPDRATITVSVSRGKVRVSRGNSIVATLIKGQEVKVDDQDSMVVQKNIAVGTVAGWQQGHLVYDDEPLQDIIADLQRVYSARIQISNNNIRQLKISTRFRREEGISEALEILCRLTDTQLLQKDSTYIIQ
ncbi:MAG: FecR domain-containing protein [Puia sp.]